ncbi:hypothetical protein N7714_18230 [Pseudomonas aeruginosa]|uniref:hypothetical protein n=1 Tax=Pseudomonas aeruginosa TaxID=287 RepID=UPI00044C1C18|nr:hypothetical protein [Pseudomonas aeruginosa]ELM3824695.1 hypothetical protein [Pseudomonas aeruginosa]ELP1326280.1 hypothetical protein [Pseudomonas aeruginosa]EZN97166.1 hypothetical protein AJ66_05806 [Pseudomonas aeruginosa 3579]EZO05033.1 hypothetical protein AJ65_05663 [Pseudomonas aeruginosa 3578]MBG4566222.1 hypothetical protein [Pseudomonas aeruginosa]
MSSFEEVNLKLNAFSEELSIRLGQSVVQLITLPQPSDPKDELYFRKLVAWSYAALVEAFPVALKKLTNFLRTSNKSEFTGVSELKTAIQALRTVQSHNLPEPSSHSEKQKKLADIWLLTYGSTPFCWATACTVLCNQLIVLFDTLMAALRKICQEPEDQQIFIEDMSATLLRTWPAHAFDELVKNSAEMIGLTEFDIVSYRQTRIERWRELANLFTDRSSAMAAVGRAISVELISIFGESTK